jgi:hypothetical protein
MAQIIPPRIGKGTMRKNESIATNSMLISTESAPPSLIEIVPYAHNLE